MPVSARLPVVAASTGSIGMAYTAMRAGPSAQVSRCMHKGLRQSGGSSPHELALCE